MDNSSILAAYNAFKNDQRLSSLCKIQQSSEYLKNAPIEEIEKIYQLAVSSFQSKGGTKLERIVEDELKKENIPFQAQVHLNADGIILESRGVTIIDIVFGNPIVGDSITNYAVLSLKTTSRERAKQDGWTKITPPKLFLYASLEDDYPQPEIFNEGPTRKLICVKPKKKDLRQFKLGFEHLIDEVRSLIKS
jgi:hypothetical protein